MKVKIDTLRPPDTLIRELGDSSLDMELLRDSISCNGLLTPLTVADGTIVDGYRRWKVCKSMGWTEIEVHHVDGDPAELRVIAQTRKTEFTWDDKKVLMGHLLEREPEITPGEVAHRYKWSPVEVEQLVGVQFLCPEMRALYDEGKIPIATVWLISRTHEPIQLELLDGGLDGLHERAEEQVRLARNNRRSALSKRPRCRGYTAISKELANPVHAGPALIKAKAETPMDGWLACLRWILQT